MKITENQLRSIIKKEVSRSLNESVAHGSELDTLIDSCKSQWMVLENDAPDFDWEMQVDRACRALESAIIRACDSIENQLIDGEFYRK
jgi:hypothetical protein